MNPEQKQHRQRDNGDWEGHDQIGNGSFDATKIDKDARHPKRMDESEPPPNETNRIDSPIV